MDAIITRRRGASLGASEASSLARAKAKAAAAAARQADECVLNYGIPDNDWKKRIAEWKADEKAAKAAKAAKIAEEKAEEKKQQKRQERQKPHL